MGRRTLGHFWHFHRPVKVNDASALRSGKVGISDFNKEQGSTTEMGGIRRLLGEHSGPITTRSAGPQDHPTGAIACRPTR